MAHKHKNKSASKGSNKTFAAKRTMNPPLAGSHQGDTSPGGADYQHDQKRRLGSFAGKGEHARTGSRGRQ
jgi:hypothetical protein